MFYACQCKLQKKVLTTYSIIPTKRSARKSCAHLPQSGCVTHECVVKLNFFGSDLNQNWILCIWPLGTNFSEILSEIHTFPLKIMCLKMPSRKWQQLCHGLIFTMFASNPQCFDLMYILLKWCAIVSHYLLEMPTDKNVPIVAVFHTWMLIVAISLVHLMLRSNNGRVQMILVGRTLIARFLGPTWGPSGAGRTQVGPMFFFMTSLWEGNSLLTLDS